MRLDSVRIRYTRHNPWVLDGITLDLSAGTVTTVIGGNGSGKSTLLKVTCGLIRPTTGAVVDRPRRIGYVPERLPSDMRFSAHAYLVHMGCIQGLGSEDAARRGSELLDELQLEGGADSPISTLSKGNAQKVALAQALIADPQMLVLDEPWSGLDTGTRQILVQCLDRQRESGVIVLLAEHRTAVGSVSADVTYRLDHGRLVEQPADVGVSPSRTAFFAITLRVEAESGTEPQKIADTLLDLPGVLSVRAADTRVHLEVDASASDSVLTEALRNGHSVHEVRLVEAADPRGGRQ